MSFSDFVKYLATPAALGVVSSIAVALLRRVWPQIEEGKAVILSWAVAALAYLLGGQVLPLLPQLPPQVELYWPAVVWFCQQVWYWLMKDKEVLAKLYG